MATGVSLYSLELIEGFNGVVVGGAVEGAREFVRGAKGGESAMIEAAHAPVARWRRSPWNSAGEDRHHGRVLIASDTARGIMAVG